MHLKTKICGLNDAQSVKEAIAGKAYFIGFVFYDKSPRNVTAKEAAKLCRAVPKTIFKVGVFVNPNDQTLDTVLSNITLDYIQLHGNESVDRISDIKARYGVRIIKAVSVSEQKDILSAKKFTGIADWVLFDAKPPVTLKEALPGGNAISFDWNLLSIKNMISPALPWILSGGLNINNLKDAVGISGANAVDVSSGVESAYGKKNPRLIREFLKLSAKL